MKSINKLLVVCLGIFAMTTINAYQDSCAPKSCEPKPVKQCECPKPCGCSVPAGPTNSAYNHPGRIDVCGSWDVYVTGSFIYWQAIEEDLALGTWGGATQAIRTIYPSNVIYMDFDYKPGFKVGLGYNFTYDNWNAYLEYTRLHLTDSKSSSRPSWAGQFNALWNNLTNIPDEIRGKWKLKYDMLDLELARSEYRGKELIFRPFVGMRGGWIDQNIAVTTTTPTDVLVTNTATATSDSWLVGLRAGIYSDWMLGEGFSFLGKAAGSLVYQKFSKLIFRQPDDASLTDLETHVNFGTLHRVAPILELMLGLNWGTYFDNNNWHFDLFAGYEFQYLWHQNQLPLITKNGNLMFHGLTVSARLDF